MSMIINSKNFIRDLPEKLRISIGSAIVLGLLEGKLDAEPTTVYLMTYKTGKCTANCGFCPQARNSLSKAELLSRVSWPAFLTQSILKKIQSTHPNRGITRVCIQVLNYPDVFTHLVAIVTALKQHTTIPVSVSCPPLNSKKLLHLAEIGVDRICIALDATTEKLFSEVKGLNAGGPYTWESQFRQLHKALRVFGKGKVSTHLIIGLGETENDAISLIQKCVDLGILPALFAFTPIHGTTLEHKPQPLIESYRRVQLARYLIVEGRTRSENMHFDDFGCLMDYGVERETLRMIVETGKPFLTSGCPGCNRPFYNEKPSGPIYNYPRKIRQKEIEAVKRQLHMTL
jgi:biotin synthase